MADEETVIQVNGGFRLNDAAWLHEMAEVVIRQGKWYRHVHDDPVHLNLSRLHRLV